MWQKSVVYWNGSAWANDQGDMPTYSPDLNPVEHCGLRLRLICVRSKARSLDNLCVALKDALDYLTVTIKNMRPFNITRIGYGTYMSI